MASARLAAAQCLASSTGALAGRRAGHALLGACKPQLRAARAPRRAQLWPAAAAPAAAAQAPQAERPSAQQQPASDEGDAAQLLARREQRRLQREREQGIYQASAIAATLGVSATAAFATYSRISWHLQQGEAFPWAELASTLLFVAGGMVGMEMYARWVHRALWHETEPGWALHKSHHEPRLGAFELNDIYAVANALPAMGLCLYGLLRPDVVGGLCFGAGLGITLFGISYMFVHDGLVHRRFPVGPIAELPQLKRVVAAHKLHHSEKYGGVPFGMFLGPQELEAIGAGPDLDKLLEEMEANAARAKAAAGRPS